MYTQTRQAVTIGTHQTSPSSPWSL